MAGISERTAKPAPDDDRIADPRPIVQDEGAHPPTAEPARTTPAAILLNQVAAIASQEEQHRRQRDLEGDNWAAQVKTTCGDLNGTVTRWTFLMLAVFALWAAVFPLGSAVVGTGFVIPSGQSKQVQHRNGGTIRAILKREGDKVAAGDVIAELDPAINQAELTKLRARRDVLLAMRARLEAENELVLEMDRTSSVGTPVNNTLEATARIWKPLQPSGLIGSEQAREFERGRSAMMSELQALEARADALNQQAVGTRKRADQTRLQIAILTKQEAAAVSLTKGGHLSQQQLWDIQTRLIEKRAEIVSLESQAGSLVKQIEEVHLQIQQARMRDARQTSEKLTEVLGELDQTWDQLRAAETELGNTALRAPVSGTIVHMANSTVGGVIRPGDTFAEIVPAGTTLEMQARISSKDIAGVRPGQDAEVRISSLNQRLHDKLPAKVVYRAADATVDQRTGERYFDVRVILTDVREGFFHEVLITPGMTGEVFIKGDVRTFANYIMEPLVDSFARAFAERR